MSLKEKLLNKIAEQGEVRLEVLQQIALDNGYRIGNCDRRLRELCESENSLVSTKRNEKGYIISYVYKPLKSPVLSPKIEIKDRDRVPNPYNRNWKKDSLFNI